MNDNRLFLIDAYALIFRAYYSMGSNFLYNSKKQNVTAIMGFTNALWKLIKDEKPTHLAVVFDHKSANVRVQEFEYYKAHRDETPEDIKLSEPYIREIIEAFHIPILEVEGYEADDVIGAIAKRKAQTGHIVYMVTPDKDFAQLVEENIKIYKPSRQGNGVEILGVEEVKTAWQVDHPTQVIDILALWGDAVDNIPGIPGIGEKTAKLLIKQYGSVENLIANSAQLKGKQKENVETYAQQGLDSKKLATIILDVPIEVSDEDLELSEPNKERLRELFAELEFRTLGKEILGDTFSVNTNSNAQKDLFGNFVEESPESISTTIKGNNIENTPHTYTLADTAEKRQALIQKLESASSFAFDTETTSLDITSLEIIGLSFSTETGEGFYVPCPTEYEEAKKIVKEFSALFSSPKLKIGQNIKYDIQVLKRYDVDVLEPLYDTMLAHYVLEPELKHGMDYLAENYLGYTPVSYDSLTVQGRKKITLREVPIEKVTDYAAEDADITYQLYQKFNPELEKFTEVNTLYHDVEMPLVKVLADMEREGVRVDEEFLNTYSAELQTEILQCREKIFSISGTEFNMDSPKQLGDILFDKLKIPYTEKMTKTGQYATGEDVLVKLKNEHEIITSILEYREIAKLKSTYVDALPRMISAVTGRVHTSFNQAVAATGRLSSTDPNLQNIPIRTERGRKIRRAFIPQNADFTMLSADYSQIELRLIAELSGDENMQEAFLNNEDIHTATAAKVFGVAKDAVTKEMRSHAKTVNFGIIYGVSAFGLAQQTSLSRTEAKEIIENYFKTYPKVKSYMDKNIELARTNGFVETILGRRRYLRDINSKNAILRGSNERIAINAPVQGSAADMIKVAMIQIHQEMLHRKLKSSMILQVHDELVFDTHKDEVDEVKALIISKMQHAIPNLKVPIVAEVGMGANWLEAH